MAEARPAWSGRTDGTLWMHRSLIKMLRVIPLPVMYVFVSLCVVPVYMVVRRSAVVVQWHFFRRRMGWGRGRSAWGVVANHCLFAQAVLDRFYLFSGGRFDVVTDHYDLYQHLAQQPDGFVVMSAHVGCYEVAGSTFRAGAKRFNAVVYGGEGQAIQENRRRMLEANNIHLIPIRSDMGHVFAIGEALQKGEVVSIAGDRVFGSPRTVECQFFGASACFPMGPFALAVQRALPVLMVTVMKEGRRRYHVNIVRIDEGIDTSLPIKKKAALLAQRYATQLETEVRQHPTQWYNYFEFWNS